MYFLTDKKFTSFSHSELLTLGKVYTLSLIKSSAISVWTMGTKSFFVQVTAQTRFVQMEGQRQIDRQGDSHIHHPNFIWERGGSVILNKSDPYS